MQYDVTMDKKAVGVVTVTQEGLYSRFQCTCALPDTGIHKLVACCNDRRVDIGICVPTGKHFGLDTKLPRKKLGEGSIRFMIFPMNSQCEEIFVPVRPEEPFAYLQMLADAHTEVRGDSFGVLIPNQEGSM